MTIVPERSTATFTVSEALPFTPSDAVAVIVAVPWPTPVATPLASTVAIAVALLDQVNVVLIGPPGPVSAAEKLCVAPAFTVAVDGVTLTVMHACVAAAVLRGAAVPRVKSAAGFPVYV